MYLRLDPSTQINVRPNLASWKQAAATNVTYIAVTMMSNGTIMAVGAPDGELYTLATPDSAPTHIPNSGAVRSVTVMWDGTIVGVGLTGNGLWTRATLIESPWVSAPSDVRLVSVSAHPEGGLLGLSDEGVLLSKGRPSDPVWQVLPFPKTDLVAIAARRDGSVLGVGRDNLLYIRPNLVDSWRQLPGSAAVTGVADMPDGSLVVLGTDGLIYTAAGVPSVWTPAEGDGGVIAAATAPDGSIVALDPDGQVVTRPSVGGTWTKAPAGTPMIDISVFSDGVLLGVNRDQSLYTRAGDLRTDWAPVPDSGSVTSATVLADGVTILGVGTDVGLWTRTRTGAAWVPVQGSNEGIRATSVNGLRDGSILGIEEGTNDVLRRIDLQNPWETCAPGSPGVSVIEVPEPGTMVPDAHRWLLQFTSSDPADSAGDGRPWGDGTAMAARASGQRLPWDYGNRITPLVGGFTVLGAIRDAFETAILEAEAMADRYPPGKRGHVLIVDWLLNGLRDLSEENSWGGGPWKPTDVAKKDQTALGLILRMMSVGITVRVLLWEPTTTQAQNLPDHANEHWSVAAAIQDHNTTLTAKWGLKDYVGVCELDLRTASPLTATLHQKMVAIRVGNLNVAFCGGVDLAFTRRDFARPADELIGRGDWQSGDSTPVEKKGWPKQSPAPFGGYPDFPYSGGDKPFPEDLPANVYGNGPRHWHDHHLKLEGPIVTSLEQQFAERWIMNSSVYVFDRTSSIGNDDQVQLTSALAIDHKNEKVASLPPALPCAPVGDAAVQMWRTIPLRPDQSDPPFARGEFTVMAGVAQAVARSKNLITIWDQYFWSLPLAVLLADRLRKETDLHLLIVLPPYGSSSSANEMWYRRRAVQFLWNNLDKTQRSRVLALNTWAAAPTSACTSTRRCRPTTTPSWFAGPRT